MGMSDDEFVKSFFKDDFVYGFDVAKAINRSALSSESREFSVFNILANATKDILLYKNDEPVCKQDAYLRWNEI